ncbi:hypothetical protein BSG1_03695 [Bacillus sp. SG-1]|nr:hypothetical protein BSG1_03695 [Bacillus sp. SG-1]
MTTKDFYKVKIVTKIIDAEATKEMMAEIFRFSINSVNPKTYIYTRKIKSIYHF